MEKLSSFETLSWFLYKDVHNTCKGPLSKKFKLLYHFRSHALYSFCHSKPQKNDKSLGKRFL